jgi:hypothetical protein
MAKIRLFSPEFAGTLFPVMKNKVAKGSRITSRISVELKDRILEVEQATGISESDLVIMTMDALCRYFKKHDQLTTPFEIVPRSHVSVSAGRSK